jgi:hypothetical protein
MGIFEYIVLFSCLSAFFITLMKKWGIVEWVQVHGNNFFYKMFSCDFCLSWWMNVLLCFLGSIATYNALLVLYPLICTPITKKLL